MRLDDSPQIFSNKKLMLRYYFNRNKRLSTKIQSIRKKLRETTVEVPNDVSVDIKNCLSNALKTSNLTPYQKLIWTEQVKLLGKKTGAQRYHPEVIRSVTIGTNFHQQVKRFLFHMSGYRYHCIRNLQLPIMT